MSTPARLGRYSVRRRIGSGGFATVWLAYDEQLDSPVAVKVLADNWTEDHHVRQRFVEEGRFLRKVDSPHVVPVYDAGELEDGRPFLVMAYADQGNLADRLAVGPLGTGQALSVVRQVGSGLQALHRRGVLHRDVKPANVLFRTVGHDGDDAAPDPADGTLVRAMVGDLGLGKALDMSSRLTMIGGTPSYVSPEQAQGEKLDSRSDEYSLGVLAYQLLAGHPPYSHASLAAAAEPPAPPAMGETVPEEVQEVVLRALARDPEDRWPSVGAFLSALGAAAGAHAAAVDSVPETWIPTDPDLTQPAPRPSPLTMPRGSADPPVEVTPRRRRRLLAAGAALVALVVGASVGSLAFPRAQPTVTMNDGTLAVTVPRAWSEHQAKGTWLPPHADREYVALSAGATADWNAEGSESPGVFVGLMPGREIPEQMPGHPECGKPLEPNESTVQGDAAVTLAYPDCPGGVTIERVVQVSKSQLLWVQVRTEDRGAANEVLDTVRISGM